MPIVRAIALARMAVAHDRRFHFVDEAMRANSNVDNYGFEVTGNIIVMAEGETLKVRAESQHRCTSSTLQPLSLNLLFDDFSLSVLANSS